MVKMSMLVYWSVSSVNLQSFEGTCCVHVQPWRYQRFGRTYYVHILPVSSISICKSTRHCKPSRPTSTWESRIFIIKQNLVAAVNAVRPHMWILPLIEQLLRTEKMLQESGRSWVQYSTCVTFYNDKSLKQSPTTQYYKFNTLHVVVTLTKDKR